MNNSLLSLKQQRGGVTGEQHGIKGSVVVVVVVVLFLNETDRGCLSE